MINYLFKTKNKIHKTTNIKSLEFSPEHIDEEHVKKFVSDLQKPIFYVSGPEPMVESMGEMLNKIGIPENHIKQDFFPGYPTE